MKIYLKLSHAAKKLGLPKKFTADLTEHDRAFCEENTALMPFLWNIHENGTHIMSLPDRRSDVSASLVLVKSIHDVSGGTGHWFFFDGVALLPMRFDSIGSLFESQFEVAS